MMSELDFGGSWSYNGYAVVASEYMYVLSTMFYDVRIRLWWELEL